MKGKCKVMKKKHRVRLVQDNMLCHKCVLNVLKSLTKINGIEELGVDLETKQIKIVYNNENMSRQKIQEIIDESIIKGKVRKDLLN